MMMMMMYMFLSCCKVVTENIFYSKLAACFCRRLKYNTLDNKAILCSLLDKERYKKCGGNTVWNEFERLKV